MKNFKNVLTIALFLLGATLFAQTKLTGKVVDENNIALPGADVVIKGTTNGTNTDFDGKFSLECKHSTGVVVVSFMGYDSKNVEFNGSKDLGTISLALSANTLDEIVIVGVADIAKDRQTPVAVSTIKAAEIVEKLGSNELPELLNATPSVYATKQGGGFGDSRINIRGFNVNNTAVLINGVPVNDMESGWVYFSNWAGLSDVTSAMQVQRGLGSSKLAISSVGGTINILTKTSDAKVGGNASFTYGNDNYMKGNVSYSTGLLESGLSASVLLSQTQGDGYADGTKFKGNTYFIGLGYKINDNQNIMFTATGAPQWHHQRYSLPISTYLAKGNGTDPNTKYNNQWGYYKGEEYSWVRNFYHKPVASLNWDWKFNETSNLSTVLYASWGRGGGTGTLGKINTFYPTSSSGTGGVYNSDGLIRFDDIATWNAGGTVADFGATRPLSTDYINGSSLGMTRRASMNSHDWYGVISNFHKDFNESFAFDFGVDARTYVGMHYRILVDLLGADGYKDTTDKNNPSRILTTTYAADPSWNPFVNIKNQDKIAYYNDGNVNWLGAFMQVEYKADDLTAFLQGGASDQGYQRVDYFIYGVKANILNPAVSAEQKSGWTYLLGGNIKGGLNYNINENHNVFVNAGYYSKQPMHGTMYLNNTNTLNPNYTNEKIIGVEAGYGFRSQGSVVNINIYRTTWDDRYARTRNSSLLQYTDYLGVNEIHKGIEIDGRFKASEKLTLTAMSSIGDWTYKGNAVGTTYSENDYSIVAANIPLYLDNVKVGDAAQFTARLGLDWKAFKNFSFDINQSYFDNLYGNLNATSFTTPGKEALKLPSYSLTDAGFSYKFNLGEKMHLNFRFNVNNLFDHVYISESYTSIIAGSDSTPATWNGVDTSNQVYFGFGRTWNTSVRFNF